MLGIRVENFTDLAVVECRGRVVHSDAVFKLRDVVQSQDGSRLIVVDLSEVESIGGGGVGMLAFLSQWARQRGMRLKLFSPSETVVDELAQTGSLRRFEFASFQEMIGLVARSHYQENEYRAAA